jgi:NAD(P)-dependent dehydrogenase (short-subunit alcohol dehydrogenase family)
MKLKDKKIVITGAASGIGYQLVTQCLDKHAVVFGIDLPDHFINIDNPNFHPFYIDISNEANIDQMFLKAQEVLGGIDIFIANAGFAYYERLDVASWSTSKKYFILILMRQYIVLLK